MMPCLPGEQHRAVFGDFVLFLVRRRQIVRVDVPLADKDACDAGALGFGDEILDFVAEGVDLNHQPDWDAVTFTQLNEPVEYRFPLPVSGEIVVGEKEFVDALAPIEPNEALDLVG